MKLFRNILLLIVGALAVGYFVKPLRFLSDMLTFNYFKKSDDAKSKALVNHVAEAIDHDALTRPVADFGLLADDLHAAMRMSKDDISRMYPNPSLEHYLMPYNFLRIQEITDALNVDEMRAVYAEFGARERGYLWWSEQETLDKWFKEELSYNDYEWVKSKWERSGIWTV